jgi:hypothetical protein
MEGILLTSDLLITQTTAYTIHKKTTDKQTSKPSAQFKPKIPSMKRQQTAADPSRRHE